MFRGRNLIDVHGHLQSPSPILTVQFCPVGSTTFCSTSSRPVSLNGLPKDNLSELLCLLLQTIDSNSQTCEAPEDFLVRGIKVLAAESELRKVVLVGASNLRRCADLFEQAGYMVVDLTVPGWIAPPEKIAQMQEKI